jgi:hypothetical protein
MVWEDTESQEEMREAFEALEQCEIKVNPALSIRQGMQISKAAGLQTSPEAMSPPAQE